MAVTFAQAAVLSQNQLQRGVYEMFVQASPVLDRVPFIPVQGNAFAYNVEQALPGVAWRGYNEAYVESTGVVNQQTEKSYILGGDSDLDTAIVLTQGNINDQRGVQLELSVKAQSIGFQEAFFNGDSVANPKQVDGLRKRLTGAQVIAAGGANGAGVIGDGTQGAAFNFLDKVNELLYAVPGITPENGAIYANTGVLRRFNSVLLRAGGAAIVVEDINGKRVLTYNGIPLLDAGPNTTGADILSGETTGTATNTSSMYAVKFSQGEAEVGVAGLNFGAGDIVSVRDLGELDSKPAYRTRVESVVGVAAFGRAAARLTGILPNG